MEIGWFFLWLGVALAGLGLLLLRTWWRERRFDEVGERRLDASFLRWNATNKTPCTT